jgi:DNA-binding GntR family transcriptional regulator
MNRAYELEKLTDVQLLKDRVYSAIKSKIIDLSFKPGEQLIEQRLAEVLGVSKSPIRDAFQRLEAEGLVKTVPYKGCFVATISRQEFKDVFQLREAMELFCIEQSFDSYTDDDIRQFEEIMDRSVQLLTGGDEMSAYHEHLHFHELIVEKLGNELIERIYSNIGDKLSRYLNIVVTYIPNRIPSSNQQHQRLLSAIQKRDKNRAVDELRIHLTDVLQDYLVRQEITSLQSTFPMADPKL